MNEIGIYVLSLVVAVIAGATLYSTGFFPWILNKFPWKKKK